MSQQQQVFVAFSKESHQKFVVGFCNEICQPRGSRSYRRKDRLYFSLLSPRIPIVLPKYSTSFFWVQLWNCTDCGRRRKGGWTHINLSLLYWNAIEQYKKEWGRSGLGSLGDFIFKDQAVSIIPSGIQINVFVIGKSQEQLDNMSLPLFASNHKCCTSITRSGIQINVFCHLAVKNSSLEL